MQKSLSRRSFLHTAVCCGMAATRAELTPGTLLNEQRAHGSGSTLAITAPFPSLTVQEGVQLRVVTLNVWALPLLSKDVRPRLAAIVRRLVELNVDIVGLQEVWMEDARSTIIATARETSHLQHHSSFRPGIRDSGLLILSRFPIHEVGFHRFRLTGRPERLSDAEYVAGKGIGYVRLHTPAGMVDVYNFHLIAQSGPDDEDPYRAHRTAAVYEMVKFVAQQSQGQNPVLLLGDLNTRPDQLGYKLLTCADGFRDAYQVSNSENPGNTISDRNPYTRAASRKRIDYIFTKDGAVTGVHPKTSRVIMDEQPAVTDGQALVAYSDHYGVLSEIELWARHSPAGAFEERCAEVAPIWREFRSYVDAALTEARSRLTSHYARALGGAVLAPTLYRFGRVLTPPVIATNAAVGDTAVAIHATDPEQGGDEREAPSPTQRIPLRRNVFLARLAKTLAVAVMTPYAVLHSWLGLWIVPDEIQELEALKHELLRHIGVSHGER